MILKPVSTVTLHSSERYVQDIRTGSHTLRGDEPRERGGSDAGPAPYDLLLAGLGACTSITLRMYAERKGWELGDIQVELRFFKGKDDERIERVVRVGAPLTEEQRTRLAEIAEKTPVTKTVRAGAPITTTFAE